jgi:hypothetical protein
MTREFERNNPLGVSLSGEFPWENVDLSFPGVAGDDGVLTPGVDNKKNDHLMVFHTMQDGANAGAWLLHDNYFGPERNTPISLGDAWAGDTENKANAQHRRSYGSSIAMLMKDRPDYELEYERDGVGVMKALCREENGTPEAQTLEDSIWVNALKYGAEERLMNLRQMYRESRNHLRKGEGPERHNVPENKNQEAVMADPTPSAPTPNPPQSVITIPVKPEVMKDVVVLAGIGLDGLNLLSPHIPPGVSSIIGLALRAIINLFSGGQP